MDKLMGNNRRIFVLTALMAILLLGGVVWLSHARGTGKDEASKHDEQTERATLSKDPSIRARAMTDLISQAQVIREHWGIWAKAHTEILREMRAAKPDDTGTLARVCHALPMFPGQGATGGVAGVSRDDLNSKNALFSWQPLELANISFETGGKPDSASGSALANMVKRQFGETHDIAISTSRNVGTLRIVIWASGRITEDQFTSVFVGHHLPSQDSWTVKTEIAPAFEFLN